MGNSSHTVKAIEQKLEKVFNHILTTRLQDIPIVHPDLTVKALGFQQWNNHHLGILVTPWFMNILLLPLDTKAEPWQGLTVGQTIPQQLPSGDYIFIAGFEEALGLYQSCSLFSPMFEFENQQAAELTAFEAIKALFDQKNEDKETQHPSNQIEKIWQGAEIKPDIKKESSTEDQNPTVDLSPVSFEEKLKKPLSRRDFLRGQALK